MKARHLTDRPALGVPVTLACENNDCDVGRGRPIDLEGQKMSKVPCHGCGNLLRVRPADRPAPDGREGDEDEV